MGTSPPDEVFCNDGSINIGFAIAGQITINELRIRCTRIPAAS